MAPLTNKPLNPAAQGGDHLAASGFPVQARLAQPPRRCSPGTALSARGQNRLANASGRAQYSELQALVNLELPQLIQHLVQLAVQR